MSVAEMNTSLASPLFFFLNFSVRKMQCCHYHLAYLLLNFVKAACRPITWSCYPSLITAANATVVAAGRIGAPSTYTAKAATRGVATSAADVAEVATRGVAPSTADTASNTANVMVFPTTGTTVYTADIVGTSSADAAGRTASNVELPTADAREIAADNVVPSDH